ncbi:uncharacterized protein BDW70DRAFT_131523 [Aspergillus foveolatus]|uniref:uncharacterized protein n=1 Tax=Aspergillus foveolatus TaxID=210207 RepID=UPI003CCCBD90
MRKFERLHLAPGQQIVWAATLNRRDLANWDTVAQDWKITPYEKSIFVGTSSRRLPLARALSRVQ